MAKQETKIHVSHINIRQSITILVFKLIFIDITAVLLAILSFGFLNSTTLFTNQIDITSIQIVLIVLLAITKISLTVIIVLQWLNEYYEVSPRGIIHRRGIFFQKATECPFNHVRSAELSQTVFGRIFNFGTISIFDYRRIKFMDLFLIHNPLRYHKILKTLIPYLDEERSLIRGTAIDISKIYHTE